MMTHTDTEKRLTAKQTQTLDQRADAAVMAEGMLQFDWYRETLQTTYPNLTLPESFALTPFDVIENNPQWPFCFVQFANGAPSMRCSKEW